MKIQDLFDTQKRDFVAHHNEFKVRSKVTATQANYFKVQLATRLQTHGKRGFSIVLVFAGNKIIFQFLEFIVKAGYTYVAISVLNRQYNYNRCNI